MVSIITMRDLQFTCLHVLATHVPASKHGEVVETTGAIFLDGHRSTKGYPPRRLFGGDAERLVGQDAGQLRDVLNVRLSIVLGCWCPAADDGTDGVQSVLVIVRAGEQVERCTPSPFQ